MKRSTIVFVSRSGTTNEYIDQSSRYRVYNPAKALARAGYQVVVTRDVYDNEFPMYGNVYLFHRPAYSPEFFEKFIALKAKGARLVCDFDDLNFDPSSITENSFFRIRDKSKVSDEAAVLYEGGSMFDTILTSTQNLEVEAKNVFGSHKYYANIGLGVDDTLIDHIMANRQHYLQVKGRRTVGYLAGSNTHALDFPIIEDAIHRFLSSHAENRFLLMGQIVPSPQLRKLPNFYALPRMSFEQMFEHAATCKILVAPLQPGRFNAVKAATKIIENTLVSAYTCATPVPSFDETGFTYQAAETAEDWANCISTDFLRSISGGVTAANLDLLRSNWAMSKLLPKYEVVLGL